MRRKILAKSMLVNAEGAVLVLRRSPDDEHNPGRVDFPGGGVELDETYAVAAAREAEEEAGLQVQSDDLRLIYSFTTYDDATDTALIRLLYAVRATDTAVQLSHEHDAYWWRSPEQVAEAFASTSWSGAVNFVLKYDMLSDI